MELQALKDQLEAERQAWVASCAKKEVGGAGRAAGRGFPALPPSCADLGGSQCSLSTRGSKTVRIGTRGRRVRDVLET